MFEAKSKILEAKKPKPKPQAQKKKQKRRPKPNPKTQKSIKILLKIHYKSIRNPVKNNMFIYFWPYIMKASTYWVLHEHVFFCALRSILIVKEHQANFCWENDVAGRRSWSWRRMMILAEDRDPCRSSWSWQTSMFLLELYDSGWELGTSIWGPPRNHLGTIFGQVPKLTSNCFWTSLGSKFDGQELA